MNKLIFTISIALLSIYVANAQQVWTQEKGKYFAQIGFDYHTGDGIFDGTRVVNLSRKFVDHTIQGYLEYGISNKLTGTFILPYHIGKTTKTNENADYLTDGSQNTLSNIQLGLTYNFYKKNGYIYSVKANTMLPTAKYDDKSGIRSGIDAFSFEPTILGGYSNSKFFTSYSLGLAARTNNYSSLTLVGFQIGKSFGSEKRTILIFNIDGRISTKDGKYDDKNSKLTGYFLNDLTFVAAGLKGGYNLNSNLTAWVSARAGFIAKNVIAADENPLPGLTFSLSYKN